MLKLKIMSNFINLGVKDLASATQLNPGQTMTIPANINGTILIANNSVSEGSYALTMSGQTVSGPIPANGSKLVTYSSAQVGILKNTDHVSLEVSVS